MNLVFCSHTVITEYFTDLKVKVSSIYFGCLKLINTFKILYIIPKKKQVPQILM